MMDNVSIEAEVFEEANAFERGDELMGSNAYKEKDEFQNCMESKHEHILPIESESSMHANHQPLFVHPIVVEDVDSESEHPLSHSRDAIAAMRHQETTESVATTDNQSSHIKAPVDPYEYLDSLHSRLDSTHFRRDEHNEDYIDFLFEKIESVACEMDGQPETVRDILDEAFEFLEDATCGKMARQRHAAFRESFEQFLQQIDRIAALAPNEDSLTGSDENKDLLDILCQHFEKASCNKNHSNANVFVGGLFSKELLVEVLEYFNSCTSRKSSKQGLKSSVHSLLSVSEASSEGIERFKEPLFKISEEFSFVSSEQSHRVTAKKVANRSRLRNELTRRNNFRRLRSNIHGHVSKKHVVKKVAECRDTVNEAFGSAGEHLSEAMAQLATIFENMEMDKLWESFVLGVAFSSTSQNDDGHDESDTTFRLAPSEDLSIERITMDPGTHVSAQKLGLDLRNSATTGSRELIEPGAVEVHDTCIIMDDPKRCLTSKDRPLILSTSSEETFASGCGSGRSGSSSRRFQQVDDMKRIKTQFRNKMTEFGRLTPDSQMTEPTCDETISVVSDQANDHVSQPIGARRLKMVDSESSRMDRMEMLVYMSFHDRKEKQHDLEINHLNESSERSKQALSMDARLIVDKNSAIENIPKSVSVDGLPPRPITKTSLPTCPAKTATDVSSVASKVNPSPSLESKPCGSFPELDPELGRASNRSNRSLFLQDSGSVSAVSIEETLSIETVPTNLSTTMDGVVSHDNITKPNLSIAESFCESFVSAQQSVDSCESGTNDLLVSQKHEDDSVASFSSARSRIAKSHLPQTSRVLDDVPDDELHRVVKQFSVRPKQENSRNLNNASTENSAELVPAGKSWFNLLSDIFKNKREGSWFGNQTIKVMMLLLYVSASVEATSNASTQERFQERKRQFQERMGKQDQPEEAVSG